MKASRQAGKWVQVWEKGRAWERRGIKGLRYGKRELLSELCQRVKGRVETPGNEGLRGRVFWV